MVWFARAVAEDSMFPLAHYRLAMTAGWSGGGMAAAASAASTRLALHFADRLPPREQLLVRVMALRADGELTMARDTLRAYLQAYPDDAEAWFILADDEYHASHESIAPLRSRPEETLVLFDRVFGLDPSFTPALIHPLEIAFRSGDAALIEQYVSRVHAVAPGSNGALLYSDAADALRTHDPVALGDLLARVVATADSAASDLGAQAARAVRGPVLAAVIALSPDDRGTALDAFRSVLSGTHRDAATAMLAHIEIAHGRTDAARVLLAPLARDPVTAPVHVRPLERLAVYAGVSDTSAAAAPLVELEPAQLEMLSLVAAIDRRDAAGAQHAAQNIAAMATDSVLRAIADAGYGFAAALGGEMIAGLAQVQASLPRQGYTGGSIFDALWFRWVELLAEQPQTRERAIELLLLPWPGEPALELQRQYVLGRALEAKSDFANARIAYTRFITAVGEPADLSGPMRERALSARDALARFGSQRPSTTG
jgi:tetratricopeptide (TPR) repeat protein